MNRRGFLAALAGLVVADPERLLWVPGKKMISIPKVLPAPRISLLTSDIILDEALERYSNGKIFIIDMQKYRVGSAYVASRLDLILYRRSRYGAI